MSPRSSTAWSSTGPWKAGTSVTSPPSPLSSTVASSWPRKQTLPSSPNHHVARRQPLRGPHEGASARRRGWCSVASIAGSGSASDAPAAQARRDHLGIVDHERIAGRSSSGRSRTPRSVEFRHQAGPHHRSRAPRRGKPDAARSVRKAARSRRGRCACPFLQGRTPQVMAAATPATQDTKRDTMEPKRAL